MAHLGGEIAQGEANAPAPLLAIEGDDVSSLQAVHGKGQKGEAAETEAVCGQDEVLAIASGVEHMVRLAQQTQSCEIRTSPLPWHSQQAVYCIVPKGTGSPRSLAAQHRAGRNGPQDEERSSAN